MTCIDLPALPAVSLSLLQHSHSHCPPLTLLFCSFTVLGAWQVGAKYVYAQRLISLRLLTLNAH